MLGLRGRVEGMDLDVSVTVCKGDGMIEKVKGTLTLIANGSIECDLPLLYDKVNEIIYKVNELRKPCTCPTEEDLRWEAVDRKYISSWDE